MQICLATLCFNIGNLCWNQRSVRKGSRPDASHPTGQIRGASRSVRLSKPEYEADHYNLGQSRDLTKDQAALLKRCSASGGTTQARTTATLSICRSQIAMRKDM